jgi:hypothetical protein
MLRTVIRLLCELGWLEGRSVLGKPQARCASRSTTMCCASCIDRCGPRPTLCLHASSAARMVRASWADSITTPCILRECVPPCLLRTVMGPLCELNRLESTPTCGRSRRAAPTVQRRFGSCVPRPTLRPRASSATRIVRASWADSITTPCIWRECVLPCSLRTVMGSLCELNRLESKLTCGRSRRAAPTIQRDFGG